MSNQENDIKQIMDNVAAGLIDDPIEDYKYLVGELENYKSHKLSENIRQAIEIILFDELPAAARNELVDTREAASFSFMIEQADLLIQAGRWDSAESVLQKLIGDGILIQDTQQTEYRSFSEKAQLYLYKKVFNSDKEIAPCSADFGKLYGLFGTVLLEHKEIEKACEMLSVSLHYNPFDYRFIFEHLETFKLTGDFDKLEELSRAYLTYAYRPEYIGHLYRNLGFVYTEKKDYETAIALYQFASVYDVANKKLSEHELDYIAHITGEKFKELSQEEAEAPLKREHIPIGASEEIQRLLYNRAVLSGCYDHDIETADYFINLLYDVTKDEEAIQKLRDTVNQSSDDTDIIQDDLYHVYHRFDNERDETLKKLFPEYPELTECRLRIEFSVGNTKYTQTVYLILDKIDDLCKATDKNHVTLYFTTLDSIKKNAKFINDIISVAGKWKSFVLEINDVRIQLSTLSFFVTDFLHDKCQIRISGKGDPEEIRKSYRRESLPPRARKERPEDAIVFEDLDELSPQEVFRGIIRTYAEVYLIEHKVQTYTVTDEEMVLVADDDLIVDFWLSPYGYGQTVSGDPGGETPYRYCTYVIQELTPNHLFRYNNTAFCQIFTGIHGSIMYLKFEGLHVYGDSLDHFQKINKALPDLHLEERYNNNPGEPYSFVIVRMANADGTVGYGIGYTGKDVRSLLLKICKNLETANTNGLDSNGIPGLQISYSKSFFRAFQSWKGEKKIDRLRNRLSYFVMSKMIKEKGDLHTIPEETINECKAGHYDSASWSTYSDIGRKS